MKTVYQQNETDCGVATLAMLANVSYEKSFQFLENRFQRTKTVSSGKIIAGLEYFGRRPLDTKCRAIGDRKLYDLEFDALINCMCLEPQSNAMLRHKPYTWKGSGHWAVWDSNGQTIRDPYGYHFPIFVERILLVE